MFRDESLYTVPIQRQASIYNRCRHFCPRSCLPLSFAAALWCHRCKLEMNLHPRRSHCNTVERSSSKPRVKVQSCVCYRLCFGTRGVVLFKSRNVKKVADAGGVFNCCRWLYYRRKKESRFMLEEGIYLLEFLRFGSYAAFRWLMNTQRPSPHLAQPPGLSWMRSRKMRFNTCGEDSLRRWALPWHLIPLLPLRHRASQTKVSSYQVAPIVQPSNTATNA